MDLKYILEGGLGGWVAHAGSFDFSLFSQHFSIVPLVVYFLHSSTYVGSCELPNFSTGAGLPDFSWYDIP
jgi:hypothetical protein